eukprot:TRINITY_DN39508_c0_g1_i1.p1 TRINITY_DN39508_c0_g1~~TRINITY_DN39508_c0_g1_i1.p1  ORF type:complete len:130 (+),score=16.99 TRINITY_DN39508_c0_g1_i1:40-429(+)
MKLELPVYKAPKNPLTDEPAENLNADIHPVETIQKNWRRNQGHLDTLMIKNVFGSDMVMRLKTEDAIFSQFQRLPTLPSSHLALETLKGLDEDIDLEDYLGDPSDSLESRDLHRTMEVRLGMKMPSLRL